MKIRAEAMQEASEAVPSGMLSILGRPQSKFSFACLEAREHCKTLGIENPVCEVANYLFPDCRVVSGHLEVGVGGNSPHRLLSRAAGWNPPHLGAHRSVLGAPPSHAFGKHAGARECGAVGTTEGGPRLGPRPHFTTHGQGPPQANRPAHLKGKTWARRSLVAFLQNILGSHRL